MIKTTDKCAKARLWDKRTDVEVAGYGGAGAAAAISACDAGARVLVLESIPRGEGTPGYPWEVFCVLPIPRLPSAGELGSMWGVIYQGAGNIAECLAFGRIAGKNAANEPPQI